MKFGIMFFSTVDEGDAQDKYALLKEAAVFADRNGLCCVWTPERHFHEFGGLFPNPAVVSSALAVLTSRIQLRAGSVISPLHHPIRIAEEWAVVDNLSGGRAAISFGSGWNAGDFVLCPDNYEGRKDLMFDQIDAVRKLWRGGSVNGRDRFGRDVSVSVFPRPVQKELPVWITSSSSEATCAKAGAYGANLLTHLLSQDISTLASKIRIFRDARHESGHGRESGIVSLMLHTFIGDSVNRVKEIVHRPFCSYLKSAMQLEQRAAAAGGVISGGKTFDSAPVDESDINDLAELAFDRYFQTAALLGTIESTRPLLKELERIGVNEIACLIDFGVPAPDVLESLKWLAALARESTESRH